MPPCRYVICTQHDLHFLPYINVPGARISWLVAMCGVLADAKIDGESSGGGVRMNPRALRSSMVLRLVLSRITSDRAPDEVLMRHIGTWVQNATAAAMVHYFSSRGAAPALAALVRLSAAPPGTWSTAMASYPVAFLHRVTVNNVLHHGTVDAIYITMS